MRRPMVPAAKGYRNSLAQQGLSLVVTLQKPGDDLLSALDNVTCDHKQWDALALGASGIVEEAGACAGLAPGSRLQATGGEQ